MSRLNRVISKGTVNAIVDRLPRDRFKLTDSVLNKEYKVIGVTEVEDAVTKSFYITLEDTTGRRVELSGEDLMRSRVISEVELGNESNNIINRSDASELWHKSSYLFRVLGIEKGCDFIMPEKLMLRCAILSNDYDGGIPKYNQYNLVFLEI